MAIILVGMWLKMQKQKHVTTGLAYFKAYNFCYIVIIIALNTHDFEMDVLNY